MARLAGLELNDKWRVIYALTKIKGIGWSLAEEILSKAKIDVSKRVSDLSKDELSALSSVISSYEIEGDLARKVQKNISRLKVSGTYRGMRHSRGLPARGQRTKSNARTKRGKRKTVGSFRKEALAKMQQQSNK